MKRTVAKPGFYFLSDTHPPPRTLADENGPPAVLGSRFLVLDFYEAHGTRKSICSYRIAAK